jgi:uncharacterized protein (DUF305 family)
MSPTLARTLSRATLAASIATSACATHARPVVQEETRAAEPVHEHGAELPASAGTGFTVADVRFMQNMIGHHAQALRMTAMAPARGASARVLELARKIDISQRDEIAMMEQWLVERRQTVPGDTHQHAMMPGMLNAAELAQLDAARGREFDRLFLEFMIRHHQGALKMVEELFASPRAGQDSDIFRFATDVDADQRDEIFVMERLLDTIREESR